MSAVTLAAVVVSAFFLIGIGVGVLAVIAASALRGDADRARRKLAKRADAADGAGWTGSDLGAVGRTDTTRTGWEEPPGSGDDSDEDDGPPR